MLRYSYFDHYFRCCGLGCCAPAAAAAAAAQRALPPVAAGSVSTLSGLELRPCGPSSMGGVPSGLHPSQVDIFHFQGFFSVPLPTENTVAASFQTILAK